MGTFNELRDVSEYRPRLFTKSEGTSEIGFLRFAVKGDDYEYEIGPVNLRPFRLFRCLFSPSPRHIDMVAYCSVMQTQERVYAALTSETTDGAAHAAARLESEKVRTVINGVVRGLRKKRVGKHLNFLWDSERIQMEIIPDVPSLR